MKYCYIPDLMVEADMIHFMRKFDSKEELILFLCKKYETEPSNIKINHRIISNNFFSSINGYTNAHIIDILHAKQKFCILGNPYCYYTITYDK